MFGYQIKEAIEQEYLTSTLQAESQWARVLETTATSVPVDGMPEVAPYPAITPDCAGLAAMPAR